MRRTQVASRRSVVLAVAVAALLLAAACQPKLGSRGPSFGNVLAGDLNGDGDGNDPGECVNPQASCAGPQPYLWASINSAFYQRENGDPFAVRCLTGTSCGGTPTNPDYRPSGYTYGIEVAEAGQTVTVELYDAPAYYNPPNNFPGDSGVFRTQYELFGEDGSGITAGTDPALSLAGQCDAGPGRRNFPGGYQSSTYHNRWWTLCTFTAPTAGVYPLQVRTSDLSADPETGAAACSACFEQTTDGITRRGINSFAVRASTASGAAPRTYALGDLSIYTPTPGTTSTIPLVEVSSVHAGSRLVVDLFDPGDGNSGSFTAELNAPGGADVACTQAVGASNTGRTATPTEILELPTECRFVTRDPAASPANRFNSRWVRLAVDLPADYACSDDCWWTYSIQTSAGSLTTDRLTATVSFQTIP